ncbi:uncharacterized protein TrAtP1_012685 [Trichoderma atroviride]|uniref:uncharacterized protein n=1 Tax=Hypocrea atroviridis TaxID=63577 RepID=UPI0033316509|nr:hypothetical protein TrAtP1_012685 [Trichoderma atroviride]
MELEAQAGARPRILPWAKLPKRRKRVAAVDRQEVQIGRHHTRSYDLTDNYESRRSRDPGPAAHVRAILIGVLVAPGWTQSCFHDTRTTPQTSPS